MILCPICKRDCLDRRVLGMHLTRTHSAEFSNDVDKERALVTELFGAELVSKTVQEYVDEQFCIDNLPIDIAKFITLLGLKRTSKQERATDRYKQTYTNGLQLKFGPGITNPSQVKSIQEKKERSYAERVGSYDDYLKNQRSQMRVGYDEYVGTDRHKEALDKAQQTCIDKYGNINFGQGEVAKKKSKQSLKATIASWDYEERLRRTSIARAAIEYSSKPEKRVRKVLIDLDVESLHNHFMWNYNWDLVIDKIIIEVQGIFWHAKPDRYEENDLLLGKLLAKDIWAKDARKRAKAESEGYIVIEIWEDEIHSRNDDELLLLVRERLMENGYKF